LSAPCRVRVKTSVDDLRGYVDPLGSIDPPEVVGGFEVVLVVADFVADRVGLIALSE
jgi:hypothetical protein